MQRCTMAASPISKCMPQVSTTLTTLTPQWITAISCCCKRKPEILQRKAMALPALEKCQLGDLLDICKYPARKAISCSVQSKVKTTLEYEGMDGYKGFAKDVVKTRKTKQLQ